MSVLESITIAVDENEQLASVNSLLVVSGPSTVLWTVRTIVVDTVESVARWARTHVFKKGEEGMRPPIADGNASATPVIKPLVSWVKASLLHLNPYVVLATLSQSMTSTQQNLCIAVMKPTQVMSIAPITPTSRFSTVFGSANSLYAWFAGFLGFNGASLPVPVESHVVHPAETLVAYGRLAPWNGADLHGSPVSQRIQRLCHN